MKKNIIILVLAVATILLSIIVFSNEAEAPAEDEQIISSIIQEDNGHYTTYETKQFHSKDCDHPSHQHPIDIK
jgi:hypothetical protein